MLSTETIDRLPAVPGALSYLSPMTVQPRTYAFDPPSGAARSNLVHETHTLPIHDMRPVASDLSLDSEGFALIHAPSTLTDFSDEEALRRIYYPQAEHAIIAATGAERVVVFDHTIRRRIEGMEDRTAGAPRQPASRIHGDYTEKSGPQRLADVMGSEATELVKGHYAIINLWRPIRGPLQDAPLALCDARTVAPGDLITQELIYSDRSGEIFSLTFNPAHRWFYAPDMQPDEALLLKCYDSLADGRARFMPHTAFDDPTAPANKLPRESIELRTLVFYPS